MDGVPKDDGYPHGSLRLSRGSEIGFGEVIDLLRSTGIRAAVVDLETNGLDPWVSVLSCSAIEYQIEAGTGLFSEVGRVRRYYFPTEPFSQAAIRVHGLTEQEITRRRAGAAYPRRFRDDGEIVTLIQDCDLAVCHNANFDTRFFPIRSGQRVFCTMKSNIMIVGLRRHDGTFKYPSLRETARHYGVELCSAAAHDSLEDAVATAAIFQAMVHSALALPSMLDQGC